jgi:hypothetical protein
MGLGVFAAGWLLAAGCKTSAPGDDALKALGGTTPAPQYGEDFWRQQRDAGSAAWRQAKRICDESLLSSYPNCLPVLAIIQADKKSRVAKELQNTKHAREMWARDYDYDKDRKLWFPVEQMIAAGCSYSGEPGNRVFHCPPGAKLPQGEK